MTEVLLGVDVGTSSAKAALMTPQGVILATREAAYPTRYPRLGWVEQAPEDWWDACGRAVRGALQDAGKVRVAGIGVSGQGCAVTLLGAGGEVLRPAIVGMDSRSTRQAEDLRRRHGPAIEWRGGKAPGPYNAEPVLLWLAQHEPEVLDRAVVSLTTTGYVLHALTGVHVMNASDASILFAYDLHQGGWADDLIAGFGLPRRLYPPLAEAGEVVGGLTARAAAAWGVPAGTPVVAGGEDTSSAALAVGAVRPGQAVLSLGTAGTVNVVCDAPRTVPQLLTFRHVLHDRWLLGGSTVAMGGALEWAGRALAPDVHDPALLAALAGDAPPGADGLLFLPYLSGELQPINDGNARGAFVGLTLNHTRPHLIRAVMEGAAFSIAHNLALTGAAGGALELRAVGGPTRSGLWCQVLADVTGQRVAVFADGAGAPVGDALLAAGGVGLIPDVAAAAERRAHPERVFEPRRAEREVYQHLLGVYQTLYGQLHGAFAALAGVQAVTV